MTAKKERSTARGLVVRCGLRLAACCLGGVLVVLAGPLHRAESQSLPPPQPLQSQPLSRQPPPASPMGQEGARRSEKAGNEAPSLSLSGDTRVHYTLGPGDKIRVTVYQEPDLSGEFEVDVDGAVSLPLIGEVRALDHTIRQLEHRIEERLADGYLRTPRVSIDVLNYRPFYILGEVKEPGSYAYVSGMTVLKAVVLAGGFTYRARENRLRITRASDPERREHLASKDTPVLPGDIIRVPERYF